MIVPVILLTVLCMLCAIGIVCSFLMTVSYYWCLRKAIRATRVRSPYLYSKLNDFSLSYKRSFQVVLLLFLRRAHRSRILEVSKFGGWVRRHARKYMYMFLINIVIAVALMGCGLAMGLLVMVHELGLKIGWCVVSATMLVAILTIVVARVGLCRVRRILAVVLEDDRKDREVNGVKGQQL